MKRVFILLGIVLLLSGCSSEYNVKITSDSISDDIYLTIDKSLIGQEQGFEGGPEDDEPILPFIQQDQYVFIDKTSSIYKKELTEDENYYYLHLYTTFKPQEYGNSSVFNRCFENVNYENNKDYYDISLSGEFYCLYGDSLEINLNTENVVKSNNADKVSGNTYTWVINSNNEKNANVSIRIMKETKLKQGVEMGIIIAIGLVALVMISFIIFKIVSRRNRNEI